MYQGGKHLDKAAERSGGFKNIYVSFMLVRQSHVTTYVIPTAPGLNYSDFCLFQILSLLLVFLHHMKD